MNIEKSGHYQLPSALADGFKCYITVALATLLAGTSNPVILIFDLIVKRC